MPVYSWWFVASISMANGGSGVLMGCEENVVVMCCAVNLACRVPVLNL